LIQDITRTLKSGWWGKGKKVIELEKTFAKIVGSKYAIAINSNTSGLDLILKVFRIQKKEVISPTISFITTAVVPMWNNCKTILTDVEYDSVNIDINEVKKNISKNTAAVIAVNYSGNQFDIKRLRKIYKGLIIEDCAWSFYNKKAGKESDIAVWSFQAVKTISCGDGGIITTNSKRIYEKLKKLSNFGISKDTYERSHSLKNNLMRPGYVWDYKVDEIGYKSYMNDIQATILLSQIKSKDNLLKKRELIMNYYNKYLSNNVVRPINDDLCGFYSCKIINGQRNQLMEYLSRKKIHTTIHYKPLHRHPLFKEKRKFPIADKLWKQLISLPCHSSMSIKDAKYVVYWINKFFEEKSN
jgi:perosamine synthetase